MRYVRFRSKRRRGGGGSNSRGGTQVVGSGRAKNRGGGRMYACAWLCVCSRCVCRYSRGQSVAPSPGGPTCAYRRRERRPVPPAPACGLQGWVSYTGRPSMQTAATPCVYDSRSVPQKHSSHPRTLARRPPDAPRCLCTPSATVKQPSLLAHPAAPLRGFGSQRNAPQRTATQPTL